MIPSLSTAPELVQENNWNKLPDEVAEMILCGLPAADVLTARTVCRQWRRLLSYHRVLYPVHLFNAEEFGWCAWDAAAARWRRLPPMAPSLEKKLGKTVRNFQIKWCASSRGFVLLWNESPLCGWIVYNPVTMKMYRYAFPACPCTTWNRMWTPAARVASTCKWTRKGSRSGG